MKLIRNRGSANACIKIGVTLIKISVLHNIIHTSNIIYEFALRVYQFYILRMNTHIHF